MAENNNSNVYGGGLTGLGLTIIFLFLKIFNVIDWPWIWVFSPIWIPIVIILGVLVIFVFFYLIASLIKKAVR